MKQIFCLLLLLLVARQAEQTCKEEKLGLIASTTSMPEYSTPPISYNEEYDEYENNYDDSHDLEWRKPVKTKVPEKTKVVCLNLTSAANGLLSPFLVPPSMWNDDELTKEALIIYDSQITVIPPSSFKAYPALKDLNVTRCNVQRILPGAFDGLSKLETLTLADNNLTELSTGVLNSLTRLTSLDLSKNNIQRIPEHFFLGVHHLKWFNMAYNNFTHLERFDLASWNVQLVGNASVQTLLAASVDFSHNKLTEIDFSSAPACSELNLKANEIRSVINSSFSRCTTLNLAHNYITDLEDFSTGYLNHLNLESNWITTIKASTFKNASNLVTLNLSNNSISVIEEDAFLSLRDLEILKLNVNNLTDLPVGLFRNSSALDYMNLCNNSIENFKYGIFEGLSYLQTLHVCNNKLKYLHEHVLAPLRELRILDITHNEITHIYAEELVTFNDQLQEIHLDDNKWNCKNLLRTINFLIKHKVDVIPGSSYNTQNTQGIACINNDHLNYISNKNLFTGSQKPAKEERPEELTSFKDTQLVSYFDQSFNDTAFFKYFESLRKQMAGSSKVQSSGFTEVVSVGILVCLLIITCLLSGFAVYIILNRHHRNFYSSGKDLSQMEELL